MNYDQEMGMRQKPPLEVLDSFGASYTNWKAQIVEHIVSDPIRKVTAIIVDGLSADTKKTVGKQIAADLSSDPEITHFEETEGVNLRHFRLTFGDVWRLANKIGLITTEPGSTPEEQYAQTASLTLLIGVTGLVVLPRPAVFYNLSVAKTAMYDDEGQIVGVNRNLSLARFLAEQGAFYANLGADYDLVQLGMNQRMEMLAAGNLAGIETIMARDRLVLDTDVTDQQVELEAMGRRGTRLQQEATLKEVAWWAIQNRLILGYPPNSFQTFEEFNEYMQGQILIDFIRDHYSPVFVRRLYQSHTIPNRVTFLEAHTLGDTDIHIYNRPMEKALPVILNKIQKPEFHAFREAFKTFGIEA